MTSSWAWRRLKSPASQLFAQTFIQAQIKESIKAPRHWPLCGEFTETGEFPAQMASNVENVSIWWRHHDGWMWSIRMRHTASRANQKSALTIKKEYSARGTSMDMGIDFHQSLGKMVTPIGDSIQLAGSVHIHMYIYASYRQCCFVCV